MYVSHLELSMQSSYILNTWVSYESASAIVSVDDKRNLFLTKAGRGTINVNINVIT